jgi:hypothetical protein
MKPEVILAWPPLRYFTFYRSDLNVSCMYGSSKPRCRVSFQNFNVSVASVATTSEGCESAMLCKIKENAFEMTSNGVTFVPSFVNICHFIIWFDLEDTLIHTSAQATWHSISQVYYIFMKGKEAKPYPGGVDDIGTGFKGLSTNCICELLKCGNNCTPKFCSGHYCLDQLDAFAFSVTCCDGQFSICEVLPNVFKIKWIWNFQISN